MTGSSPPAVHVVVPEGIDDPARPSGGNSYDRRVCDGLRALGWAVREHPVPGPWPAPDAGGCAVLAGTLASLPDHAVVLLDGLIACAVPEILVPEAARLRQVVLVHMPLEDAASRERTVLSHASAVLTTSGWAYRRLLARYGLPAARVHVAEPGVDAAAPAPGTPGGGELLCVGAVAAHKGYDTLVAALATLTHLSWRCVCVGALDRDADFVARLRGRAQVDGFADRLHFTGPLTGADLEARYAAADVLVHPSRGETYGMVVTEALARGLPVVASAVGGLPDTLGRVSTAGSLSRTGQLARPSQLVRPGMLVKPGDPVGLRTALCGWLTDVDLRKQLRENARERRGTLAGWAVTSDRVARVLGAVAA